MRAGTRPQILRNALAIAAAVALYGVSFGALSVAGGLDMWQTMALSVIMFSGASQFALVGVVAAGGGLAASVSTALLLGTRNALYGVRLAGTLDLRSWRRPVAAQLVVDESVAMVLAQERQDAAHYAFWASGTAIFVGWNLGTLVGGLGAGFIPDPRVFGLDAAAPAAFLALLAPRLKGREPWAVAAAGALVALVLVPVAPAGVPVLAAGVVAVVAGLRRPA